MSNIKTPNEETLDALAEDPSTLKGYTDVDVMVQEILEPNDETIATLKESAADYKAGRALYT